MPRTPPPPTSTMAPDTQVALSQIARTTPGSLSKMTRQVVPPFLQKLYEYVPSMRPVLRRALTSNLSRMVNEPSTDDLIRWSENGDSFYGAFRWTDTTYGCHNARISLKPRALCTRGARSLVQTSEVYLLCPAAQHVWLPQDPPPPARRLEKRQRHRAMEL